MLPPAMLRRQRLIAGMADAVLAPAVAALRRGEPLDLVPVFQDFTTDVITALLAVPSERRGDFQRWNRAIMDSPQLKLEKDDPRYVARAGVKREISDFLDVQIDDRRARFAKGEKPDDLLALMVAAEGINGITREIAADNILNLFLGGLDTTVRWMGNVVSVLRRHPDALDEIVADRALIPQACEEVLRYETIIQMTPRRVLPADLEVAGQLLPQGKEVFLMSAAGNRDPAMFEDPDRFDIHRPARMHLGFGMGMHQCIGMHLARVEIAAFFNRLFDEAPRLDVLDLGYGSSWAIWGPERLVVALPG
jgi:cytochrome P450